MRVDHILQLHCFVLVWDGIRISHFAPYSLRFLSASPHESLRYAFNSLPLRGGHQPLENQRRRHLWQVMKLFAIFILSNVSLVHIKTGNILVFFHLFPFKSNPNFIYLFHEIEFSD